MYILVHEVVQNFTPRKSTVLLSCSDLFICIAVHELVENFSPRKSTVLLSSSVFHAFTCCDMVSAFNRRGEKTAWETWKMHSDVTTAFQEFNSMNSATRSFP